MQVFIISVLIIIVVIVALCIKNAAKSKNRKFDIERNKSNIQTTNNAAQYVQQTYEIDRNIIEPNKQLVITFFHYLDAIGRSSSIAIREDLCNIIIMPADPQGKTLRSIENRNMIRIEVNFLDEVLELQSFSNYDSCMQKFYEKVIDENGMKYVALIGDISGDPDAFLCQLAKMIKNAYPKIAFSESFDGRTDDGSTGMIAISGENFRL